MGYVGCLFVPISSRLIFFFFLGFRNCKEFRPNVAKSIDKYSWKQFGHHVKQHQHSRHKCTKPTLSTAPTRPTGPSCIAPLRPLLVSRFFFEPAAYLRMFLLYGNACLLLTRITYCSTKSIPVYEIQKVPFCIGNARPTISRHNAMF